jgi:hypothetical protein
VGELVHNLCEIRGAWVDIIGPSQGWQRLAATYQ